MLQVLEIRTLCAPNLWHSGAVLQAEVAAEPVRGDGLVRLVSRLEAKAVSSFPDCEPHFPTAAHALKSIAVLLQRITGGPAQYGIICETGFPHVWSVVFEIEDSMIGRATLDAAVRLIESTAEQGSASIEQILDGYRTTLAERRCGGRTRHLIQAARDRGIPVQRLDDESLIQLGQGIHRRRLLTAVTDRTSLLAENLSRDKQLCRMLMATIGLPVVEGTIAEDADAAVRFAESLGKSVVVKPRDADYGNGVALNLTDPARIRSAWQQARAYSSDVIVERYQPGDWHRLLVIDDRVVAAVQRLAPKVVGDGVQTVAQLIDEVNKDPRRGTEPQFPLEPLRVGAVELAMLYHQSLGLDSVPAPGVEVWLREDAYLATGATQIDVTDRVHSEVAAVAVEATTLIGLDVAGVDIVATDISKPLAEQSLAILEVNAEPAFAMHLPPLCNPPAPVPGAILDALFPPGETGRVPLVVIVGDPKTAETTVRAIRAIEPMTALVNRHSWSLAGRILIQPSQSVADHLRSAHLHPRCASVVVQITTDDIVREGLPFDRSDVLVVSDIGDNGAATVEVARLPLSTLPRIVIGRMSLLETIQQSVLNCNAVIVTENNPPAVAETKGTPRIEFVSRVDRPLVPQNNVIEGQSLSDNQDLFQTTVSRLTIETLFPQECIGHQTKVEIPSNRSDVQRLSC